MGLAASQARMLMLTAWKSDLELRGQQINTERLLLGAQSARAARAFANSMTHSGESNVSQSDIITLNAAGIDGILGNDDDDASYKYDADVTDANGNIIHKKGDQKDYADLTDEQKAHINADLTAAQADSDDEQEAIEDAAAAKYDAEMAKIQYVDKILEMELKNIDTQHKAIDTEIEAVKKVIDKNIEKSFKTFNG